MFFFPGFHVQGDTPGPVNTFTINKLLERSFQLGQDSVYYENNHFYVLSQNDKSEEKSIFQIDLDKPAARELLRADNLLGVFGQKVLFSLTSDVHQFYEYDSAQKKVALSGLASLFKELNIYFPMTQVGENALIAVKPLDNGEYSWFKTNLKERWSLKIGSFYKGGKVMVSPDNSLLMIQQQKSILILNGQTYAPLGEIKYSQFGTEHIICQFIGNQLILLQFYTPGEVNWALFDTTGRKLLKFQFALKGEKLDTIYFAPSSRRALAFTSRKLLILDTAPFYHYLVENNLIFKPQIAQLTPRNLGVFYATAKEAYNSVPLWAEPNQNTAPLAYFAGLESVLVLERSGNTELFLGTAYPYYKIEDLNKRQGWVWGAYLDLKHGHLGRVKNDQAKIYPYPVAEGDPLAKLKKGELVEVLQYIGQENSTTAPTSLQPLWFEIKNLDGSQGWLDQAELEIVSYAADHVAPQLAPQYIGLLKSDSAPLYDDISSPAPRRIGDVRQGTIMHILTVRRAKNPVRQSTDYWYRIQLNGTASANAAAADPGTGWLSADTVTLYKYSDWLRATGEITGKLLYAGYNLPAGYTAEMGYTESSPLVATLVDVDTLKPAYLIHYPFEQKFTYKINFTLRVPPGRYYLLFIPQHLLENPSAPLYLKQLLTTAAATYTPLIVQQAGLATAGDAWPDFSLEKMISKK